MNKDEKTIRKMSEKKLLTGEQKKVLYKLFDAKINKLSSEVRSEQSKEFSKVHTDLTNKINKDAKVKSYLKTLKECDETKEKILKKIKDLGLYFCEYGRPEYKVNVENNYPVLSKLHDKHNKVMTEVEELKMKLLSDIYCLPLTAQEMTSYIEKEIRKISLSNK